jgi:hypothetical protein
MTSYFCGAKAVINALVAAVACSVYCAHAEMWKCVDADGNTRYTNVKADAKGCKSLNLEPERPAPPPAARAPARTANFPSVDSNTQRQRDVERRRLLEMELGDEQRELERARKELDQQKALAKNASAGDPGAKAYEDRVRRHESNVESLRKELANIK